MKTSEKMAALVRFAGAAIPHLQVRARTLIARGGERDREVAEFLEEAIKDVREVTDAIVQTQRVVWYDVESRRNDWDLEVVPQVGDRISAPTGEYSVIRRKFIGSGTLLIETDWLGAKDGD